MTFAWPHLLWLLLVPFALLAWELTRRRSIRASSHDKILRAEAGPHSLRLAHEHTRDTARSRSHPWLWLALACGIVALARPQWGRLEEPVFDQAREILIAIDLSRSMLATDIKPARLDRAKLLTQALLEKLTGERVGLVVFSGTAFLQSPLSSDYEILREFLPALDPTFLPEGGTNYRALIDTSLSAFASTAAADRFLIILSDGEATDDAWRSRVEELKTRGIRVIALGVGTAAGAMIPDGAGGLVKDERGAVVLSKLEGDTLRELASATNGVYQDASSWVDLASVLASTVETGKKGQFLEKNTVRLVERFQWPLALALWFVLVSLYYEFPVRPKPRAITLRMGAGDSARSAQGSISAQTSTPANPLRGGAAGLLLLALPALFPMRSASAAETPAPAEPPVLTRIVTRLANSDQRSARDWAEFGRETVTWGTRLQSAQQPVPEGPVRDALAAVELGAKADPATTDWSKLRQELEALLKMPEDQQQQQQQQQEQEQNKEQQPQDQQQKQQQQQQKQPSGSSPEPHEESEKSQPQQEQPKEQPPSDQKNESAFGDMQEHEPPPPDDTQKVGGVPEPKAGEQKPPSDPALALPLQKLEQLRDKDSPAELFQLMDEQKEKSAPKTKKDW